MRTLAGRLIGRVDPVHHKSPSEKWSQWQIDSAAECIGESVIRDRTTIRGVLAANQAVREELDPEGSKCDAGTEEVGRRAWYDRVCADSIVGDIAFDPE